MVGTSFDGVATVYSILGGHNQESVVTSNKIVESFPGMDPYSQPPPSVVHHTDEASILKKAPKWLKKPFGASFGVCALKILNSLFYNIMSLISFVISLVES